MRFCNAAKTACTSMSMNSAFPLFFFPPPPPVSRFLDNRLFATCSDDNTVRLWDLRSLRQEVRVLHGHTSWVKNIEYAPQTGKLVTSGFDGNVFSWDINK